jgi:hypothetical protein
MPVYLKAQEVGADRDLLGFPQSPRGLGVVAMTAAGLFGVHCEAADPAARDAAIRALRDHMAQHRAGPILALYGSCHHAGRYAAAANRLAAWQAEMEGVADLLGGWHGPARGCNTGFIELRDGTTIEYRPDYGAGRCRMEYRRAAATAGQGQRHEIDDATRLLEFAV